MNTTEIQDLLAPLKVALTQTEAATTELELYARTKQLQGLLGSVQASLLEKANAVYTATTAQVGRKTFALGDFARVGANALPGVWTYPAVLIVKEQQLLSEKMNARADGSATLERPKLNPHSDPLFKVSFKVG